MKKVDLIDNSFNRTAYKEGDIRLVGKGKSGKVILCKKTQGSVIISYTVKIIETFNETGFESSKREIENLINLKGHPNIMSFTDFKFQNISLNYKFVFRFL